ncbi:carbonic anhydrase 2-like [Tropilaelaps mercedesae]|uniref:Carbonic anhydrase n=1 Tax=Tropilaelaps mercedesae TaxID=418985 RepID=A0A1V9XHF6_9ACAR|nr:carbonic anhydrase 2-like [Tropilaelaps mercedesae]
MASLSHRAFYATAERQGGPRTENLLAGFTDARSAWTIQSRHLLSFHSRTCPHRIQRVTMLKWGSDRFNGAAPAGCALLLVLLEGLESNTIRGSIYGRDWGYESDIAPQSWLSRFKYCAGSRQSPINIDMSKVVVNSSLGRVILHGFKDKRVYTVKNIGSTVLVLPALHDPPIGLVSENDEDRYHFHSAHFHWTSEHAINGQYYSLEAHFVLHNEKYHDVAEALNYPDGLEVVSTMFALSPYSNNPRLRVLIDAVAHVLEPEYSINVTMALEDILPGYISAYFRYEGSLTVPTCDEASGNEP